MLPRTVFVFFSLLLLPVAQPLILSRRAALEISLTFASTIGASSSSTSATSQQPGERVGREGDERVVVGIACQHTHILLDCSPHSSIRRLCFDLRSARRQSRILTVIPRPFSRPLRPPLKLVWLRTRDMRGHRDKSALLPEAEAEELDHARHIPRHAQAGGGEVGRKARGYMVEARLVEHTHTLSCVQTYSYLLFDVDV